MNRFAKSTIKPQTLRFEIAADKLSALFSQRLICAADIRCLDHSSKKRLHDICLDVFIYKPIINRFNNIKTYQDIR